MSYLTKIHKTDQGDVNHLRGEADNSLDEPIKVFVASESHAKLMGTRVAFVNSHILNVEIIGKDVQVGVPQPFGMDQLTSCCTERLETLIKSHPDGDYYVAIESGRIATPGEDKSLDITIARAYWTHKPKIKTIGFGGGFQIPQSVLQQLPEKGELGLCTVDGRTFDKKTGGMVDCISGGILTRVHFIEMAVRAALVPLITWAKYP